MVGLSSPVPPSLLDGVIRHVYLKRTGFDVAPISRHFGMAACLTGDKVHLVSTFGDLQSAIPTDMDTQIGTRSETGNRVITFDL